jgi:hypothetical protein
MLSPFGNFNLLHSRPPLYWFIERPFVYEEPSLTDGIKLLRPEFSNIMVHGEFLLNEDIKTEYALYAGNTGITVLNGLNSTASKQMGARVGLKTKNINIGFSPAINVMNPLDSSVQSNKSLYCIDVQAEYAGFTVMAEYIHSSEKFEKAEHSTYAFDPLLHPSANQTSLYAALGYKVTDEFLLYGGYDYYSDNDIHSRFNNNPLQRLRFGANYNPDDNFLIKAEANLYISEFTGYKPYQSFNLAGVINF